MYTDIVFSHIFFKSMGNIPCLVAYGKNPVAPFNLCINTEIIEKSYCILACKAVQSTVKEIRIVGNIIYKVINITVVCYVTASFSRNIYFFADNVVSFKNMYLIAVFGCFSRRHHSGRARTYNYYFSHNIITPYRIPLSGI